MSDEVEEPLDARLERLRRRAETFRDLLEEGDEITVAKDDGEIFVDELSRSKLERKHPKLFGRLLAIEAQMTVGITPLTAMITIFAMIVLGLQVGWWEPILGPETCESLNKWWFWAVELLIVWYVIHLVTRLYRKKLYRARRDELAACISVEGLDRDLLLVMLLDHGDLANVVEALKLDAGSFATGPAS